MHDPMTVAHDIKAPWTRRYPSGSRYRPTLVTIWHIDPETDHTDDSCGWFAPKLSARQKQWLDQMMAGSEDGILKPMEHYYGRDAADAIRSHAAAAFREEGRVHRPWYRHPRWHIYHWRIVVEPIVGFLRRFERCSVCGDRMGTATRYGSWGGDRVWHGWHHGDSVQAA
jgi:hypothetical protein